MESESKMESNLNGPTDIKITTPIILAVVGWRYFKDYKRFKEEMDVWIVENETPTTLISGGCIGADRMAEKYAKDKGFGIVILLSDFKRHPGNTAYAVRDREIAKTCTHMLAFPNLKKGKGTQLTIGFAKRFGKKIKIMNVE